MENAAKALLMAGSILLAIIVISLLLMSHNKLSEFQQAKVEREEKEEIVKFNEPFISYQKNRMYGTDLISVLNLAISNNEKYNVNYNNEYYVNICFHLNNVICSTTYTYKLNTTSRKI